MNEIKTSWSKKPITYGTFDDYIIIESLGKNERFSIRPEEFDFLMRNLFDNWKNGKSKYIQILKEWNECIGFADVEENPSILLDIDDTIDALRLVDGVNEINFGFITKDDLTLLINFLFKHQNNQLKIWKE